jgi:hypothetical protein
VNPSNSLGLLYPQFLAGRAGGLLKWTANRLAPQDVVNGVSWSAYPWLNDLIRWSMEENSRSRGASVAQVQKLFDYVLVVDIVERTYTRQPNHIHATPDSSSNFVPMHLNLKRVFPPFQIHQKSSKRRLSIVFPHRLKMPKRKRKNLHSSPACSGSVSLTLHTCSP